MAEQFIQQIRTKLLVYGPLENHKPALSKKVEKIMTFECFVHPGLAAVQCTFLAACLVYGPINF